MNRQECRTKRIDSVYGVTWIPLCVRDGSVIKYGRGEGETLSIHVVWTRCALGLKGRPVRQEIPLCSAVLKHRVREVDPTYVVPHKEQLSLYSKKACFCN